MVIIGVDPHKASHTAVAVSGDEAELGRAMRRLALTGFWPNVLRV